MPGTLALVGGAEWTEGCVTFDRDLLERASTEVVHVLPTAAAYEQPERAVATAARHFERLGAAVVGVPVLRRPDASQAEHVDALRTARFVYLAGGSPMHLRSVLKDTPAWEALVHALDDGAVVAASSAGAMVLTDPMVDPRGGAFTVGLGLLEQLAVVPHVDSWSTELVQRTVRLAPRGVPVLGVPEATAAIRGPEGRWTSAGVGDPCVWLDGADATLDTLP